MDPSTRLPLGAPPQDGSPPREAEGLRRTAARRLRRMTGEAVLWLHRQADRFDLIPSEFGRESEVVEGDARSIAREWWRQARLWAAYNPEEMFALKAGAVALGLALVILIVLVGAVR